MDNIERLARRLKERPTAIIFGSFLHGSGRSFLADKLAKSLEERGIPVTRLSSGQIFRELAKREGKSIEEFIAEITRNKKKGRQVDLAVDNEMKRRILEELGKGKVVIVDSNLAPFYAPGVKVLVKVDPKIAGERVYKKKRESDFPFSSPEDARRALEERTKEDLERYKELAESEDMPEEWRAVYKKAVENWGNENLFDVIVDNSGTVEESMIQLLNGMARILESL